MDIPHEMKASPGRERRLQIALIVRLLAFTAVELHSPGRFFASRKEFPSTTNAGLPISKEGEAYLKRIKNNEFMLDSYLIRRLERRKGRGNAAETVDDRYEAVTAI